MRILIGTALATLLTGCAHTSFYEDAALKKETGFAYYAPKPYLLIQRTGAKDKPIEVSIVYLPDLSKMQYAKQHPGWGSSDFSLTLTNGIVTQVGQKLDSKGPETVTALAGLATSIGGLAKGLADAAKVRAEADNLREEAASIEARRKAAGLLESAAKSLNAYGDATGVPVLTSQSQRTTAADGATALLAAAKKVADPYEPDPDEAVSAEITRVLGTLGDLPLAPGAADTPASRLNNLVATAQKEMKDALKLLKDEAPPKADFELYEILQTAGKTELKRVKTP